MKILFIIDYLSYGGTERHLRHLVKGLARENVQCAVAPIFHLPEVAEALAQHSEVFPIPFERMYTFEAAQQARRLADFIRSRKIDIVQTYGTVADLWGALVAKAAGVNHIISSRRDLGEYRKKRHILLGKVVNRSVCHFLAPCNAVAHAVTQKEAIDRQRVTTIYNGFDPEAVSRLDTGFISDLWQKYKLEFDHFVIGQVAHFRPEKGHEILVAALRRIKNQIPKMKVLLVGGGPEMEKTRKLVEGAGLRGQVIFTGFIDVVLEHVALMDVCCLSAVGNEGFSNAILEQMAMEKAVVATDVGGNREAIQHEKSGLIVPSRNPEALAHALLRLYSEPQLRHRLAVAAKERAFDIFTVRTMVDKHLRFYRNLMDDSRNGRQNMRENGAYPVETLWLGARL